MSLPSKRVSVYCLSPNLSIAIAGAESSRQTLMGTCKTHCLRTLITQFVIASNARRSRQTCAGMFAR
jgi:hypothetical protein